jgi:FkbM family methyltransferase
MRSGNARFAFDIGCHHGHSSRKLLNMGWTVVAVEANPTLAATIAGDENLTVITGAVSGRAGIVDFFINETKDDWSSIDVSIANRNNEGVRRVAVCSITLEMLMRHFGVPDYVKVDIEGGEIEALRRMGDFRPTVLSLEIDHLHLSADELVSFASELGYSWGAWAPQWSNEIEFPRMSWNPVQALSAIPSPWCDLFLTKDPEWQF